jgi:pimeloyl-ACP methyl ester carboxylesterase
MNLDHSQLQTRFSLQLAVKALALFASILILGSFATSHAQRKRTIAVSVKFAQGCIENSGAIEEMSAGSTKWDGGGLWYVPVGRHNLRVIPNKGLGLIVKEIAYEDWEDSQDGTTSTPRNQKFDNPAEAGVTIDVYPHGGGYISPAGLKITLACGAVEQKRLPIIFLPGVAGTELKDAGTGNQVWPLVATVGPLEFGGNRFKMMLDRDGIGNAERVKIGDILRSRIPQLNFYGGMITFLTDKGYKEYIERDTEAEKKRANLFILPYDWRLDLDSEDHFNRLDQIIDLALKNSGAKKVILLAHSMGGVIARAYLISRPASAAKVDSLISMGTPYWGSVKPYYGLVDGYDFGNPDVTNKTMKILARNFPAAHFLLPQLPFMCDTNVQNCDTTNQWLSLDESFSVQYTGYVKGPGGIDDYTADDRLIWNINAVLLERARRFWARMGTVDNPTPLPSGVKHYVIIGYGNQTMDGYRLETATDDDYVAIGSRRVKGVPLWGDGDITVPLKLAQIKTATKTYYVRFKVGVFGSKIVVSSKHGDLPAHPTVQSLVWDILEGKPNDGVLYSYSKPSAFDTENVDFTLHSDAHLSITDEGSGGRLGFNSRGGIDQTLPTGSFVAIGKAEYASLANVSNRYQVTVEGIREGKFTLEINIGRGGNTLTKFYYPEVPVRQGTRAQLNLSPTQAASSPPPLTVTTDGRTTTIPASIGTAGGPGIPGVPPVSTAPIPGPPASGGIGGTWATPSGDTLILTQDGNRVTGTYRGILGTGTLSGTFDGQTLTGTIEGGQGGITVRDTFSLRLTPEGRLEGRFGSSVVSVEVILTRRP